MIDITSIDVALGINIQLSGETDADKLAELQDSHMYGETRAEDCPEDHPCHCSSKSAIMAFSMNHGGKSFHITSKSSLPMHKVKSYGTWKGDTYYRNNKFINFSTNKTVCGAPQTIFRLNPSDSDFIPMQNLEYTEFNNVADDAMAYIMDPPAGWNNPSDCIGFPCTTPYNVVWNFQRTKYSGANKPYSKAQDFQIISDNPGVSETFERCEFKESWNAWQCENDYLGLLMFMGLDADWEDRMVSPVYVHNDETGYLNKLNSQMDHMWDGFYTGQKHKSQFQAMI